MDVDGDEEELEDEDTEADTALVFGVLTDKDDVIMNSSR